MTNMLRVSGVFADTVDFQIIVYGYVEMIEYKRLVFIIQMGGEYWEYLIF